MIRTCLALAAAFAVWLVFESILERSEPFFSPTARSAIAAIGFVLGALAAAEILR